MNGSIQMQRVSLRQAEGGRAVRMAECGFGLAIVPVDEMRRRLVPHSDELPSGERSDRVKGFTFFHSATGMRFLPKGWFFTSVEAARACLLQIGARWGSAFDTQDINAFQSFGGPVMDLARQMSVVSGKWHDLSSALDGFDEAAWAAGAAERRDRMKALKDSPANARRNSEAA